MTLSHLIMILSRLIMTLGHLIMILSRLIMTLGHLIMILSRLIMTLGHLIMILSRLIMTLGHLIMTLSRLIMTLAPPRRTELQGMENQRHGTSLSMPISFTPLSFFSWACRAALVARRYHSGPPARYKMSDQVRRSVERLGIGHQPTGIAEEHCRTPAHGSFQFLIDPLLRTRPVNPILKCPLFS